MNEKENAACCSCVRVHVRVHGVYECQSTVTLVATHACENLWTIKTAIRIKWSGVEINGKHKKIIMCHFYSLAFYVKPNRDTLNRPSDFIFSSVSSSPACLLRLFYQENEIKFFTIFHDRVCTWPFVYMRKHTLCLDNFVNIWIFCLAPR